MSKKCFSTTRMHNRRERNYSFMEDVCLHNNDFSANTVEFVESKFGKILRNIRKMHTKIPDYESMKLEIVFFLLKM